MKEKKRKIVITVLTALAIAGAVSAILLLRTEREFAQSRTFPAMGTAIKLTAYSKEQEKLEKALTLAQEKIHEIETLCNIFQADSELSKLNLHAFDRDVVCSPLLWELMVESDRFYRLSGGAFDVTIKPMMKLWGFHRKRSKLPSAEEIDKVRAIVGWDKVKLDHEKHSVRFLVKGIGIDMGGIAKGFTLDKIVDVLRKNGIRSAVLNLGGNIMCMASGKRAPYRIGIRDPQFNNEVLETVEMSNHAIATSGNYERYVEINGKQYTHIMDPRNGQPVSNMLSVTVITPRGVDSDALSTVMFIRGEEGAEEICNKFPSTGILIVRKTPEEFSGRKSYRFGSFVKKQPQK